MKRYIGPWRMPEVMNIGSKLGFLVSLMAWVSFFATAWLMILGVGEVRVSILFAWFILGVATLGLPRALGK